MVHTTLNIHISVIKKLNNAVLSIEKELNELIVFLLKKAMEDHKILLKLNETVKYQERDKLKRWKKCHVFFREDEYEFCLDMRKFYKMSVSKILAYSVHKYLNMILESMKKTYSDNNLDNYLYTGYIFLYNEVEGSIIWKRTWGIPVDLNKFYNNEGNYG